MTDIEPAGTVSFLPVPQVPREVGRDAFVHVSGMMLHAASPLQPLRVSSPHHATPHG